MIHFQHDYYYYYYFFVVVVVFFFFSEKKAILKRHNLKRFYSFTGVLNIAINDNTCTAGSLLKFENLELINFRSIFPANISEISMRLDRCS